jgi:membrane-associated HD superfamily phosphohydrolase
MADSGVQYDFTKNKLALRLRLMGILLLLGGLLYVGLGYMMMDLNSGYSTGPDTAAMTGDVLIMVIGVVLAVLSVLMIAAASKPSLGQAANIASIVLGVVGVVAFVFLVVLGDTSGVGRTSAIISIPVAILVRSIINQGKVA